MKREALSDADRALLCSLRHIIELKDEVIGHPKTVWYSSSYHLPESTKGMKLWRNVWASLWNRGYIEATNLGGFGVAVRLTAKGNRVIREYT